jgi:hypothetical protein
MDLNRLSRYDWLVLAGFVLTIVGLSIHWYTVDFHISTVFTGSIGATNGWNYTLGVFVFLLTLAAGAVVLLKALPAVTLSLPFPEPLSVMVLGGVSVLFVLIRFLFKPGVGMHMSGISIGYGFGIVLTLVATILITAAGFLKNSES